VDEVFRCADGPGMLNEHARADLLCQDSQTRIRRTVHVRAGGPGRVLQARTELRLNSFVAHRALPSAIARLQAIAMTAL
jgi:hypothetical protein